MKYYTKCINTLNLKYVNYCITRPNPKGPGGSCIDLIATDCEIVSDNGMLPLLISDHLPIYATKKKPKEEYTNITVVGRSYRNYDHLDFVAYLLYIDGSDYDTNNNVDEKWAILLSYITDYLEIHCLIKRE